MPRHVIHLGNAWEPPVRAAEPWIRRFGRPAGVQPGDRLMLLCEAAQSPDPWRRASLNGRPLDWHDTAAGVLECDVTAVIADRNVLSLPLPESGPAEGGADGGRAALPRGWGRPALAVVSD